MSFGTDISAAYQVLLPTNDQPSKAQIVQRQPVAGAQPQMQQQQQQQNTPVRQIIERQQQEMQRPTPVYNAIAFDQQFNTERVVRMPPQAVATKPAPVVPESSKSRKDILKTIMLSMMILLAIATHSFVDYLIRDGAAAFMLTFKQEVGARLLYPLIVFVIVYFIKMNKE